MIRVRYLSSKDAYMLIYARKESNNIMKESMLVPPAEALSIVRSLNEKHALACEEYNKQYVCTTTLQFVVFKYAPCADARIWRRSLQRSVPS